MIPIISLYDLIFCQTRETLVFGAPQYTVSPWTSWYSSCSTLRLMGYKQAYWIYHYTANHDEWATKNGWLFLSSWDFETNGDATCEIGDG